MNLHPEQVGVLGLLAAATAACTTRLVGGVGLPPGDFELGFLILVDGEGAPTRSSPSFVPGEGLAPFDLTPAEAGALLLLLPRGSLGAADYRYVPGRDGVRVELAPGMDLPRTFADGEAWRSELPLPAEARLARVELAGGSTEVHALEDGDPTAAALRRSVSLSLAIDPEICREPESTALEPFAPREDEPRRLGGDRNRYGTVYGVELLDARTAIVLLPAAIIHMERGAALDETPVGESAPGKLLLVEEVPGRFEAAIFSKLTLGPAPNPDGTARLLVMATSSGGAGLAIELAASREGLRFVRSATAGAGALVDSDIDESGAIVVVDFYGRLHVWEADGIHRRYPAIETPVSFDNRVLWTGDAGHPLLVAVEGELLLLDGATGDFEVTPVRGLRKPFQAAELAKRRLPAGDVELWAGGTEGIVLGRTIPERWTALQLDLPPSLAGCAADEYPALRLEMDLTSMRLEGPYLYLPLGACSVYLRARIADGCTTWFGVRGAAAGTTDELVDLAVYEGSVVVGGENARLLESHPRPAE